MVAQASRVFAGLPASAEAFRTLLSRAARFANPALGEGWLRTTAHNAYRTNRAARSEKGLLLLLQSLIASNL